MNSNNIIVQEYLASLKEDGELDYLFPLLLNNMGFRIVQTARESKGQSQYGKDIIAIGYDETNTKYRWYFELKGYKDRDITDKNYSVPDGVRESIIEAKDTAFNDSSIPEFNQLPIKIVVVHNGILKTNIRPTFEGFISKEFNEGEFERWDIYYLTDLFSKHLFSEYLLADNESNRLFKRTLALLDAPDNDLLDLKQLVELQFQKLKSIKGREFEKFFATLKLITTIVFHYSRENNNLTSAKDCSFFIVMRTWAWILANKYENKNKVINEFRKLLKVQYQVLNGYFKKTFPVATLENGLFAENGAFFEAIGYPLRCFQYIQDLIYYSELRLYFPSFTEKTDSVLKIRNKQKDNIIKLIKNNDGFNRPLIDNHSIPILQIFRFFTENEGIRQKDIDFICEYIISVIDGILLIKTKRNRLPELYNRIYLVSEFSVSGEKPSEYCQDSSMLLATLLEILVLFDLMDIYHHLKKELGTEISLQIAHPKTNNNINIEECMFQNHMDEEYYIESYSKLPDSFEEFKEIVKRKKYDEIDYRTDKAGFPFLKTQAHSYYKNEYFPDTWRKVIIANIK